MITRIALAQVSASENIEQNIAKGESFVREAAEKGAKIICFPELAFVQFFPQYKNKKSPFGHAESVTGPTVKRFQTLARELGVVIIINIFEKDDNGHYFDSSPVINTDGTLMGKVHMNHIAQEPLFYEQDYYRPGETGFPVFETEFGKIAIAICYDRHYPEQMRALVLKGADIIFIPQAGEKTNPIKGYEVEVQGTAFSNQVFIALVNRTGLEDQLNFVGGSFVSDPSGTIIYQAGFEREELLIADCNLDLIPQLREQRPFLRDRRPELYSVLREM